jgi:hypothetical protein
MMAKLVKEIQYDVNFVRTHTLQPAWYKYLKIFILVGVLGAYWWFWGLTKTLIFLLVFLILSFLLHMIYRIRTHKFQQSWMDFKVVEVDGKPRAKSIGLFYYAAILVNAVIALVVSHGLG